MPTNRLSKFIIKNTLRLGRQILNTVWNFQSDFSTTSNPNGLWSYGQSFTTGSTLVYFDKVTGSLWLPRDRNVSGFYPCVGTDGSWFGIVPADFSGQIVASPQTLIRYTVPSTGPYVVSASMYRKFNQGDNKFSAWYRVGNTVKSSHQNIAFGTTASFTTSSILTKGTTIDAIVNSAGAMSYDSIAANFTVVGTDLPATTPPVVYSSSVWNYATQYSTVANPFGGGAWEVGQSTNWGVTFNRYTVYFGSAWCSSSFYFDGGTYRLPQAAQTYVHPGVVTSTDVQTCVRFHVKTTGEYRITASCQRNGSAGTNPYVEPRITINNVPVTSSAAIYFGTTFSYRNKLWLQSGSFVTLLVGSGNLDQSNDTTGHSFIVSASFYQ